MVTLVNPPAPWALDSAMGEQLGLCYVAAGLKSGGYPVQGIDFSAKFDSENYLDDIPWSNVYGIYCMSAQFKWVKQIIQYIKKYSNSLVFVGGPHATCCPDDLFKVGADYVVKGPGTFAINDILSGVVGRLYEADLIPDRSIFDQYEYHRTINGERAFHIVTLRGCPYSCLRGDTPINTINGLIPIKELADSGQLFKVLTRDPKTKDICFVEVKKAFLTRKQTKMIRVKFDNNTHIDCTPDHLFIKFKNGNQFYPIREYKTQAIDLKPGDSVRAVRFELNNTYGRTYISWDRDNVIMYSRLVMEGILGRKLLENEIVHHKDKNRQNNAPANLILTTKSKHIPDFHPEISERMKINNPSFRSYSDEDRKRLSKNNKGKKRTLETRIKLREGKLGPKNPRWGVARTKKRYLHPSRINEIENFSVNHKVVSVEYLNEKEDVYCMEVPGYDWFYANNVLVHNCRYCDKESVGREVHFRPIGCVMEEIDMLMEKYHTRSFVIYDDIFTLKPHRLIEFCVEFKKRNLQWRCWSRADLIDEDKLQMMKFSGLTSITFGIESGDDNVLKRIGKRITAKANWAALLACKKVGVPVRCSLMYGNPGENSVSLANTIQMVKECQPDEWNLAILKPTPGSAFWNFPEKYGLKFDKQAIIDSDYEILNRFEDNGTGNIIVEIDSCIKEGLSAMLPWFVEELEKASPRKQIQDTLQEIKL